MCVCVVVCPGFKVVDLVLIGQGCPLHKLTHYELDSAQEDVGYIDGHLVYACVEGSCLYSLISGAILGFVNAK